MFWFLPFRVLWANQNEITGLPVAVIQKIFMVIVSGTGMDFDSLTIIAMFYMY